MLSETPQQTPASQRGRWRRNSAKPPQLRTGTSSLRRPDSQDGTDLREVPPAKPIGGCCSALTVASSQNIRFMICSVLLCLFDRYAGGSKESRRGSTRRVTGPTALRRLPGFCGVRTMLPICEWQMRAVTGFDSWLPNSRGKTGNTVTGTRVRLSVRARSAREGTEGNPSAGSKG